MDASPLDAPPRLAPGRADLRPHAAFRVAITGHRWHRLAGLDPARLQAAIEAQLRTIARAVGDSAHPARYRGAAPRLTLLSGLAEGADRVAADAALAAGWRLHVVLPFAAEQYRADFESPDSVAEFDALLARAAAVSVLDGLAGRYDAYAPLGRALVANVDLLLAVWDGVPALGVGGAATVVQSARRETVPILRFDPLDPTAPWLEDLSASDEGRASGVSLLEGAMACLLALPDPAPILDQFLVANYPTRPRSRLFDRLVALVARMPSAAIDRSAEDAGAASAAAWSRDWGMLPDSTREGIIARFASPHGWADAGALWYGASFRQSFTAIFLLTVGTVFAAGVGAADIAAFGLIPEAVEVILLGTILFFVWGGRRARSQDRWLQLRALAERLRHLAMLWPLARTTPLVRVPESVPGLAHMAGRGEEGWVAWYLRATARDAGLIPGSLDADHTGAVRQWWLGAEVEPQQRFHQAAAERGRRIHHPLELAAELFVVLAIALAAARLSGAVGFLLVDVLGWKPLAVVGLDRVLDPLLHALAVTLPAFAAGIHGFLGTADFEGGILRSGSAAPQLGRLANRLRQARPADLHEVGEVAAELARVMEGELGIWRTGAGSRRLQA